MFRESVRPTLFGTASIFACLLAGALPGPALAETPELGTDLIVRPSSSGSAGETLSSAIPRRQVVGVDAALLASGPERLWLELEPGEGRWAYLLDLERGAGDDLVWRGRFAEGDPGRASITLSLHQGALLGTLSTPEGALYRLRPHDVPGSWELWSETPTGFDCGVGDATYRGLAADPETGLADRGAERGSGGSDAPGLAAAEERSVYILVLYTPKAAQRVGARRIESLARHSVDYVNSAFANSGVDGRAFLAAAVLAELQYPEAILEDAYAIIHAFEHPLARQLQDYWQADQVVVVADNSTEVNICGVANAMVRSFHGPQMADKAYAIVGDGCFNEQIFTHEIGHLFGAMHDPASAGNPSVVIFPYAFAHGVEGRFRTLMSYPTACDECSMHPDVFSNPLRELDGVPTGIHDRRDNARTINQTLPLVATFRPGRPPAPGPRKPAAPTGLTAEAVSSSAVALRWEDRAADETGYQVESRLYGGHWLRAADLPADTTSHTVDGLQPNTLYAFRVRAVRHGTTSPFSAEEVATTLHAIPAVPADFAAHEATTGTVELTWSPVDGAHRYEIEVRSADPDGDGVVTTMAVGLPMIGLPEDTPFAFRVRAVNAAGASEWTAPLAVTTASATVPRSAPCVAGAETLCILDGRFEVNAHWRNPRPPFSHGTGTAAPAPASERTGAFTFFNPANVELVVKMLDGRSVNDAFWAFYGALSDLEYWITVRDPRSEQIRTYYNPPFEICGRGDTQAFVDSPDAPGAAAALLGGRWPDGGSPSVGSWVATTEPATTGAEAPCLAGPETLCLGGGRFRVEVEWEDPRVPGRRGTGGVFDGLGSDLTGHFWFFRPDNLELAVKILDGRAINGHFWIFWGGLSDVGYTIRVTDTESGAIHQLTNPPLTLCGAAVTDRL